MNVDFKIKQWYFYPYITKKGATIDFLARKR